MEEDVQDGLICKSFYLLSASELLGRAAPKIFDGLVEAGCRFARWILQTLPRAISPPSSPLNTLPIGRVRPPGLVVGWFRAAWQSVAWKEGVGQSWGVPVTGCHLVRHGAGHLAEQLLLHHEGLLQLLLRGGARLIMQKLSAHIEE